jgi:hypothetical protein
MATLNDLINQARQIEERIFETGGELTEELELSTLKTNIELVEKVDCIAFVIEEMKMRHAHATERMKEWNRIANQCEASIEALQLALKNFLTFKNEDKFHGYEYTIAKQLNPPKVKLVNEDLIPGEYIITETISRIDRKAILDAMKSGKQVPGADIERTERIAIKSSQRKLT